MLPSTLQSELDAKHQASAYRQRYACSTEDKYIKVAGKTYLNFSSNDYLGLANSDELKQAWLNAANKYCAGSSGSALINGYHIAHQDAEDKLADWLGFERCLLFSTGFSVNSSVLKSIMTDPNSLIIQDKLNHASLIDGGLTAAAKNTRFNHNNLEHLSRKLKQTANYKLIVTEGVFSMDGDSAPLNEIKSVAANITDTNVGLMIDDAHGIGAFGQEGKGSLFQQGLSAQDVDVFTATFGKAFGLSGAFVAGKKVLIDYLINHARSYIYSTSMSPIQAAVISNTIDVIKQQQWRRDKLAENITHYQDSLKAYDLIANPLALKSNSAIQPFIVGSNEQAVQISQQLRNAGFWVTAVRPPTVPNNTARLRLTLSSNQSKQNITDLVKTLKRFIHD